MEHVANVYNVLAISIDVLAISISIFSMVINVTLSRHRHK
jgi:hypothetical protein